MAIQIADRKGTCALCLDTVRPGDKLIEKKMTFLGYTGIRAVHFECQAQLLESSSTDLQKEIMESVNV